MSKEPTKEELLEKADRTLARMEETQRQADETLAMVREWEKDREEGKRRREAARAKAEARRRRWHLLAKIPTWAKATVIVILCLFGLTCCWNGCVACSVERNERLERENERWLREQWEKDPTVNPDYHGPLEPKPYVGG